MAENRSMADGSTGGRTRRRWSVARKAAILVELGEPGATLSVAARRHAIAPSLLRRWRRDRTCRSRSTWSRLQFARAADAWASFHYVIDGSSQGGCRSVFDWLRRALGLGQDAGLQLRTEPAPAQPAPAAPAAPAVQTPAAEIPAWLAPLPKNVLVIDTETTGLTYQDRVVTFAGILVDTAQLANARIVMRHIHLVFNPERPCHPRATAVHGHDDWTLSHQPRFSEEIEAIEGLFAGADQVVAHNASFDVRFIRREFEIAGQKLPERPVFCTMQGWRRAGLEGTAGLANAAGHFGMARAGEQHGALEDAWFALAVYLGIQTPVRLPGFDTVPNAGLTNRRPVPPRPSGWRLEFTPPPAEPEPPSVTATNRQRGPRMSTEEVQGAIARAAEMKPWDALEVVMELQRHARLEDALALALTLVDRTEADHDSQRYGVAPGYYERAAIILRKLGRHDEEIAILERFAARRHAPGEMPAVLLKRLQKLKVSPPRRGARQP
jgi:DNA polymerase-3 subunit epsilon